MNSRYIDKIKTITSSGLLSLPGNRMLVELLEEAERTTKSGIIASVSPVKHHASGDRARVAVVLAIGAGYETEDGEHVDVAYTPGDHILLNQFGVKTFSDFFGLADYKSDTIGLITDDLVQGKITNLNEFESILKG